MSKKQLLLGSLVLGLSMSALAEGTLPAAAPQFNPGLYVGAQGGWGIVNEGDGVKGIFNTSYDAVSNAVGNGKATKKITRGGIAGRAYVGYAFMPYFSLETGYTYLPNNKYELQIAALQPNGIDSNASLKETNYAIDLFAKGTLPLNMASSALDGWNLFAKLGAAYEHTNAKLVSNIDDKILPNLNSSEGKIRPAYAAGIGYTFSNNVGLDLTYTGIYGSKAQAVKTDLGTFNVRNNPFTHLVSLGVSYKFDM